MTDVEVIIVKEMLQLAPSNCTLPEIISSDSSESELEEEIVQRRQRMRHTRIKNYVAVVRKYSVSDFKSHFRMDRKTVASLIDLYGERECRVKGGWPKVSVEVAVLMSVWYLANIETFRQISDRFNVTLSCAHKTILDFIKFMVRQAHNYIKWPVEEEARNESLAFQKKNIPQVMGAIDGTHIRINKPKEHQDAYYNRKCYHSIILQAVATANRKFIDIHVGECGSMHDARVLRKSPLYKRAVANAASLFYNQFRLLGDSAYPSLEWLRTPFKDNGHLTAEQKDYNYNHSATRIVIENAFGLMKGRFRRLKNLTIIA